VYYVIFMNVIDSHAYHSENSKNVAFWQKLLRVVVDNALEALITLFHYNTRKIGIIFDSINNLANHWVIL
jgi:hypothetical protein